MKNFRGFPKFSLAMTAGVVSLSFAGHTVAATLSTTTVYDYDVATGVLLKEVVEPGDVNLCLATIYGYDSSGYLTSQRVRNCNGTAGNYTGSGTVNQEAAAPPPGSRALFVMRDVASNYTFSSDGTARVVTTNGEGESKTLTYGAGHGQIVKEQDTNGTLTEWAYDNAGRRVLEKRPGNVGTKWVYEYCAGVNGGTLSCPVIYGISPAYVVTEVPLRGTIDLTDLGSTATINGRYVKFYYDGLDRSIRVETQGFDGSLIYQDTHYDALGRVASVTRPYFSDETTYVTTFQYDALGRTIKATAPDTSTTATVYDGLSISVTNALNQTAVTTRNVMGQVVNIRDARGKNLVLAYDPLGNLWKTTDAQGNAIVFQYDLRSRKTSLQDPDLGTWAYEYNAAGDLAWQKDAKDQVTTNKYDKVGRVVAQNSPSLNKAWFYGSRPGGGACVNGAGKLCGVTADNGYQRDLGYDSAGRVSSVNVTLGSSTYSTWRPFGEDGRVLGYVHPWGSYGYTYNAYGYVQKIIDGSLSNNTYWRVDSMDAEQHITQQTYGNGVVSVDTYDPQTGRLKKTVVGNSTLKMAYGYDAMGNITSVANGLNGYRASYTYDAVGRLETENRSGAALAAPATITWAYDDIGNIASRSDVGTYSYNPSGAGSVRPHAVTGVAGTVNGILNPAYTYDLNGNLQTIASGNNVRTIVWNSSNQVDSLTQLVGGNQNKLSYIYSPDNIRVREVYAKNNVAQRTSSYFDPGFGDGFLFEEDLNNESGGVKRKIYLKTPGGDIIGVMAWDGSSWSTRYWHKDHQGSIAAFTDEAGGVVEWLAYEPYGKRRQYMGQTDLSGTLTSSTSDRGYTGHEMMDEVGLINMNGRIYDPAIGKFLSPDPSVPYPANMQSYGRYTYTRGNPLKYIDPSGYVDFASNNYGGNCILSVCFVVNATNGYVGVSGSLSGGGINPNISIGGGSMPSYASTDSISAAYVGSSLTQGGGMAEDWGAMIDYTRLFLTGWGVSGRFKSVLDVPYADTESAGYKKGYAWNRNAQLIGKYWALMLGQDEEGNISFGAGGVVARLAKVEGLAAKGAAAEFSIVNWAGYPAGVPKPQGPFRLLEGAEYDAARSAANAANSTIRREQGLVGKAVDVHEIQPVKFGGSATDPANKVVLPRDVHRQQVTPWWNQLMRYLSGQ